MTIPAESPPPMIRFGEFELDVRTRELRTDRGKIDLQEQPFQVLVALLERPGELVTREELTKALWASDTFVDFERSLNKAVNRLREALGDTSEHPRFVETLPRRGYRFIAPVSIRSRKEPVVAAAVAPVTLPHVYEWPTNTAKNDSPSLGLGAITVSGPQGPLRLRKWKSPAAILVVSLSLLVTVLLAFQRWKAHSPILNLEKMEITKLTDSGMAASAAISPDGRYVIYALGGREGVSLRLRQVATRRDVQILPLGGDDFQGVTFSPDGNYVYFVYNGNPSEVSNTLYVMPVLGGSPRPLLKDVDSPAGFSPDGQRIVFTRGSGDRNVLEVRVANADGSDDRLLVVIPDGSDNFQPGPTWSPDGRTIALSVMLRGAQVRFALDVVSVDDGRVHELYSSGYGMGRPMWMSADALVVTMLERTSRRQLWTISYPRGETHRLTNDLEDYRYVIDLTRDAKTLAATITTPVSQLWVAPAANLSKGRQITSGEEPMLEVAAAAQGKWLVRSGDGRLWIVNEDGGQRDPFADVRNTVSPASCGHSVLFESYSGDKVELRRVDADGTNAVKLVSGNIGPAICSPDGSYAFYTDITKPQTIWRIASAGSAAAEITVSPGYDILGRLSISPDGRLLAFAYDEALPATSSKLAVIPVRGGQPLKTYEVPSDVSRLSWSPDGHGLQYLLTRNGSTNIWEQSLSGGEPKELTRFTSGRIFDFSWSADHKSMLLARGDIVSDVVLLSNFR